MEKCVFMVHPLSVFHGFCFENVLDVAKSLNLQYAGEHKLLTCMSNKDAVHTEEKFTSRNTVL